MTSVCYQRQVRFQDCDAAGIVFYPRYIEMLTDIFDEWAASHLEREQTVTVRPQLLPVDVDIRFLRPSRLGDPLTFDLTLREHGRRTLLFGCNIDSGEEQRVRMRLAVGCFRPGPPVEQIDLPALVPA